jgi:hypothetical protein
MNENELLGIVNTLTSPGDDATEEELEELIDKFVSGIPHPGGTDLLFYPENWGLPPNPTSEEIVKAALSWKPRVLAMTVTTIRRHPRRKDLFCVGVEVRGVILTQVITSIKGLNVGDICAVALSGTRLCNGKIVVHGFIEGAYTAGEIVGLTKERPGVELSPEAYPDSGGST